MATERTGINPALSSGIHPAPEQFTQEQIAADPILHFFHYAHLPKPLQATSVKFYYLAVFIISNLPRNAERTVALRKLLEAKDAAVRANVGAPISKDRGTAALASTDLGEAREVGGHDIDRDGPIPFGA